MSKPEIIVGQWGKILEGENTGWYVLVKDDSSRTGGFYIFRSPEMSLDKTFDDWVETKRDISRFFQNAGWMIEWLEKGENGVTH
jgi:hypothetical protein